MRAKRYVPLVICLLFTVSALAAVESPAPIVWWDFNNTLVDKAKGIELQAKIKPVYKDGSILFDNKITWSKYGDTSANQYLSVNSRIFDMGTNDFSLEVTFRPDRYPANNAFLIGKGDKGLGGLYGLSFEKDRIIARLDDDQGNDARAVSVTECLPGKWYHLVAAYDRDDKIRLYANGNLVAVSPPKLKAGNIDNTDTFALGMHWSQYFSGAIDDVRIYKRALNEKEIENNFREAVSRHPAEDFPATRKIADFYESEFRMMDAPEAARAKGIKKGNILQDSSLESLKNVEDIKCGNKWWENGGPIISAGAYHGDCAVKGFVRSDFYLFRPDIPLTFSFYAMAPEGGQATVRIKHGYQKVRQYGDVFEKEGPTGLEKEFTIGKNWQRYYFSFMPGAFAKATLQTISIQINGNMLFDALQLEEGGLTPYDPGKTNLFVHIPRREETSNTTLFFDDETIPIECTATMNKPGELEPELVVRDFWMKERYRENIALKIPEGQVAAREKVFIPGLPRGAYRAHLESGDFKSRSIVFGIIGRELAEGSEIMGASHAAGLDDNRAFIEAMGVTWTRHGAAYWKEAITSDGGFSWEKEDKKIAQKSKDRKLRFWGSFQKPPPPWESIGMISKDYRKISEPLDEAFLCGMEEYMRSAIKHFSPTIKYWECWNEPPPKFTPEVYLQMLKRFHKVVKECDPNAVVIAPSGFFRPDFWREFMVPFMQQGGLKYCDAFSYHGYFNDWMENKTHAGAFVEAGDIKDYGVGEHLAYYLDYIRAEMKKNGGIKPIWDDEFTLWGASWYEEDERTPPLLREDVFGKHIHRYISYKDAVSMIVHYVTIAYAHGVRHFAPHLFCFYQPMQYQERMEYDQPALAYDRSVQPKAIAYAVVCNKLNQAELVQESINGDLFTYVFDKPSGSLAVIFTRHGKKASLSIPYPEPGTDHQFLKRLRNLVGKRKEADLSFRDVFDAPFTNITTRGGRVVLNLAGEPVYIESEKSGRKLAQVLMKTDKGKPAEIIREHFHAFWNWVKNLLRALKQPR